MMKQKPTIIYENTVAGSFVRRINRFTAEVLIDGETELVHVKNTGRLRELLVPKAKVTLQKTLNMNRKTAYDLISVYKPKLKWVNIDSLAPNALMKQLYMSLNYDLVKAIAVWQPSFAAFVSSCKCFTPRSVGASGNNPMPGCRSSASVQPFTSVRNFSPFFSM